MKHKLKNYLKFGTLLLGVSLFIVACQKDDDFKENEQSLETSHFQFKMTKIEKSELEENKTIKTKLSKLSKIAEKSKNTSQNKTVVSSDYGFSINTDFANYIESADGSYHSYTFPIERTIETDSIENLVLSLKPDGSYKTLIVTYNTTAQEKLNIEDGIPVDLTNKISKHEINDEGLISNIFNKETIIICLEIAISYCSYNNGAHGDGYEANGEKCPGYTEGIIATIGDCDASSSGNSTGNTDTTSDTNTTDTNTNTTTTDSGQTNNGGGITQTNEVTKPITLCTRCPQISDDDDDDDCDTSKEDLKKVFPNLSDNNASTLASVINDKGKDFGIDSKEKLQHFLSQAGHEVGGFNNGFGVVESTNYTTKARLLKIFGKYYSETDTINKKKPDTYVSNPSGHANYVYCCRMGNGNIASGDGYKYRGRGIFQLTGKTNYTNFKTWYNNKYDPDKDFVSSPELLKDNDTIAILSALWYYKTSVLDKITIDSATTVKKVTKKVNGGTNGLADRKEIFTKAKDSIDCN